MTQLVKEPTRDSNILDTILTTNTDRLNNLVVSETLGNSDHNIIRFSIRFNNIKNYVNPTMVPNFQKGDYILFNDLLNRVDWVNILKDKNAYEMWDLFKNTLLTIQKKCIPFRMLRTKKVNKPTWWNKSISNLVKRKKALFKEYKQTRNIYILADYKISHNVLNKEIRKSKRTLEIDMAREYTHNPKKFFSFYKYNSKTKTGITSLKVLNETYDGIPDIVEILNETFISVFTHSENKTPPPCIINNYNQNLSNIPITIDIIKHFLNILDVDKSPGPDGIHPVLLKKGIDSIACALNIIFQRSFYFTEIPLDWKLANISPLFKKGQHTNPNNYRPISLTSVVCKIFEKIVKNHIFTFLENANLIKDFQHGFRKGRSCLTNLLDLFEYITKCLDNGECIDIVYLDFSKAFDRVSHMLLKYKLIAHGITGNLLEWIVEWLKNRKQRVILNGVKSNWKPVISGVPQGSVLGPLLFILYINDIELHLKNKISAFADDSKIVSSINNIGDCFKLQHDINYLIAWSDKWQMPFNIDKCKVMHFGNDNYNFEYEINGNWLESVEFQRNLGIIVDKSLKFSNQCLSARNKANRALSFIKRNVNYKSKEIIRTLYNAYVRPHLEYSIQAWSPYLKHDINLLESVQRRMTKIIPSIKHLEYNDRLNALNLFSLERRRLRGDLIEVFKIVNCMDNITLNTFFELDSNSITRGHKYKFKKKFSRLNLRKNNFSSRIINHWNSLPADVIDSQTLGIFKKRLDKYMDTLNV